MIFLLLYEIASKFKLKNRKYEVVSRKGTVYELRDLESGATRQAHVTQIVRMRLMKDAAADAGATHTPSVTPPVTDEALWDRMRVGSFVLFHLRGDGCGPVPVRSSNLQHQVSSLFLTRSNMKEC